MPGKRLTSGRKELNQNAKRRLQGTRLIVMANASRSRAGLIALALVASGIGGAASAHHSFAMFFVDILPAIKNGDSHHY